MNVSSFLYLAGFGLKTILFRTKKPIVGTIIITDKCNLACRHCSVNNITSVMYPYIQIRQEMRQLYDRGVRILFLYGGEPFLWKDGEKTIRNL
ncbi:MAG: radical SAM protein, partial [Clostridia bacterium]|nr:radical SAM protein [Clostridia bacterium]